MAKVIWKPIPDYEGLYEVSNTGLVKSLCAGKGRNTVMIRKPIPDKDGYMTLCLKKNGLVKNCKIHRLVASAFIPNPNNYPEINHKDEIRSNNNVSNLEWCTTRYNQNYNNKPTRRYKPINKLDEFGNIIQSYKSVNDAAFDNGIEPSLISPVLKGRRKRAGGFKWEYQF